ncbi:MAG: phosphoribosyl-AMP cyclohydrolase [Propionibacteriaceae bacterium]
MSTVRPTPDAAATDALAPEIADLLKRDAHGLVAAVVQDAVTREVLMVGYMDDTALARTLTSGRSTFWSRSRGEYWVKGQTSGHRQWVQEVRLDCDGDALLVRVQQEGPACHTGDRTCFDARLLPSVTTAPLASTDPGTDPTVPT